ncbi:hypothetical protein FNI15_02000 [Salmonella enterica subsp. salamae]|nr:hypothetical protein [Salmonella enterica subsp. salamae]
MFKKSSFIDITPKHVYDIDISTPYVHFWVFFKHIMSRCVFLTDEKYNYLILIIKISTHQLLLVGFLIGFNSAARDADVTTGAFTSVFTDLSCDAFICLPNASCFISFPVCILLAYVAVAPA